MSEKLQQAIEAVRDGRKREAQRLLTEAIKENQDDIQAWYMLSHLVASKQKQMAYLGKVLTLDPDHVRARQRLAALQAEETPEVAAAHEQDTPAEEPQPREVAVSTDTADFLTQEKGDSLPQWLAEDAAYLNLDQAAATDEVESSPALGDEGKGIPDWLQETLSSDWAKEKLSRPTRAALIEDSPQVTDYLESNLPQGETRRVAGAGQDVWLKRLLIILVIIAILVFSFLVYMLAAVS
ncbi:MAG: tetratricopeptide repeat protein [Anaerolineae bacterium]